jgi:glycosyltransferase involved in cell wall biosynthesis
MIGVLHVVADLDPLNGGPSETLPQLWSALDSHGIEVSVVTSHTRRLHFSTERRNRIFSIERASSSPGKWFRGMNQMLDSSLAAQDLCHNHGCWLPINWSAGAVARRQNKPFILSPLGHLDDWSLRRKRLSKAVLRFLVENRNIESARAVIVKSETEADCVLRSFPKANICTIPNGIHSSRWSQPCSPTEFLHQFPGLKGHRLLVYLSRIHPKKGLKELLAAWKRLGLDRREWKLVVAGGIEGDYATRLRDEVLRQRNSSCVFVGHLNALQKRQLFSASDLFVLPSHSENFGQVVLEALGAGVPVIVSKGCPWQEVERKGCGWWVSNDPETLEKTLRMALALSKEELSKMGIRGQEWVCQEFDWARIGQKLAEVYREIV